MLARLDALTAISSSLQFRCPELVLTTCTLQEAEPLFPEEIAATRAWTASRRREFAMGRTCARRALAKAGAPSGPILFEESGAPRWPPGFVGSLSHKGPLAIAAVAPALSVRSAGIDLELSDSALDTPFLAEVCTQRERLLSNSLKPLLSSPVDLFVASKEAFYKCQFPLTGAELAWQDVEVTFSLEQTSFHAEPRSMPPGWSSGKGYFEIRAGLICALVISRP